MKFWSNWEKEYNDLFGDKEIEQNENQDENEKELEFNNMLRDIKKDLKNVPKDDLLPGLRPKKGASDSEVDDEESDVEDAKKALATGEKKKKKGKKCKIGDKYYDVGERWKDPKTGKDMICILMSIPKEVQPKLEEADVTVTKDEIQPEPKDPEVKPEKSGPQWSYTNKTAKTRGCPSDQSRSEADLSKDIKPPEEFDPGNKETENTSINHFPEDQPGEEAEPSEKYSDTRDSGKETDDGSDVKPLEDEVKVQSLKENVDVNENEEDSESDTDSEEERRQAEKESQNAGDSEYDEREEELRHTNYDLNTKREDRELAIVQPDESEKSKQFKENIPDDKVRTGGTDETTQEDASEEVPAMQEKGKTIYTKETTVTQRKLFKTSETIESVETEKNVN